MHVEVSGATTQLATLEAQNVEGQTTLDALAAAAVEMRMILSVISSVAEVQFASAIGSVHNPALDVYAPLSAMQVLENQSLAHHQTILSQPQAGAYGGHRYADVAVRLR
jgi:hypothetical protein